MRWPREVRFTDEWLVKCSSRDQVPPGRNRSLKSPRRPVFAAQRANTTGSIPGSTTREQAGQGIFSPWPASFYRHRQDVERRPRHRVPVPRHTTPWPERTGPTTVGRTSRRHGFQPTVIFAFLNLSSVVPRGQSGTPCKPLRAPRTLRGDRCSPTQPVSLGRHWRGLR
jgi:hypothetical protein